MDLLVHLETFVAVAEERSFSRAAEALGIAQPLLSRRVKSLEDHLGGELFDRSRRQIRITDLGTLLLPHANDLLARTNHLYAAVRAARRASVVALGVPADGDPRALARVIRAASERGLALGVQELPAAQRAEALADGSLALALTRVPPASASLRVPLGVASARPTTAGDARPVHLDQLRGRRGRPGTGRHLLITGEDDIPLLREELTKRAARAGLPESSLRTVPSTSAALAEMLAGEALLLCPEQYARRHQVSWAPLADTSLQRGYALTVAARAGDTHDWLTPLLAAVVGAEGAEPTRPNNDDSHLLAARG